MERQPKPVCSLHLRTLTWATSCRPHYRVLIFVCCTGGESANCTHALHCCSVNHLSKCRNEEIKLLTASIDAFHMSPWQKSTTPVEVNSYRYYIDFYRLCSCSSRQNQIDQCYIVGWWSCTITDGSVVGYAVWLQSVLIHPCLWWRKPWILSWFRKWGGGGGNPEKAFKLSSSTSGKRRRIFIFEQQVSVLHLDLDPQWTVWTSVGLICQCISYTRLGVITGASAGVYSYAGPLFISLGALIIMQISIILEQCVMSHILCLFFVFITHSPPVSLTHICVCVCVC